MAEGATPDMDPDVPRLLGLPHDDIVVVKTRYGITERITSEQVDRWKHGQDPVPEWLAELFVRRDALDMARDEPQHPMTEADRLEYDRDMEERAWEMEDEIDDVQDQLVLGVTEFEGIQVDIVHDIASEALEELTYHHGNGTWLSEVHKAALRYVNLDVDNLDDSPFRLPPDRLPHTGLLESLVGPLGDVDHVLTVVIGDSAMRTKIHRFNDKQQGVEYPSVIRDVEDMLEHGLEGYLVLRTFTTKGLDFTWRQSRAGGPNRTVRGWAVRQGVAVPCTAAETFTAARTDNVTGELLFPQWTEEYKGAWPLQLVQP